MPDSAQRARALDTSLSFIVQAPAGSGKTELLTNRYLALLTTASSPESVLALTFTNKAVSELHARIMQSLLAAHHQHKPIELHKQRNYELAKQVLSRSESLGWNILLDQSRIRVTTFDGLAYAIVGRNSSPLDIRTPTVLEQAEEYYKDAVANLLKSADTHEVSESILYLIRYFDYEYATIVRLFSQMLGERAKWITKLYDSSVNTSAIAQNIQTLVEGEVHKLRSLAQKHLTAEFFELAAINTSVQIANPPHTLADFKDIAYLCFTKQNTLRQSLAKRDGFDNTTPEKNNAFKAYIAALPSEYIAALKRVRSLPEQADTTLLEHIAKVLLALNHELLQMFNVAGGVDYTEIALRANEALHEANVTDIAMALDATIEHILIDEFQDTSLIQLTLIEYMVAHWQPEDRRTLFFVGDPMQSIYLFRGAEVGVFLSVKERGLGHIALEPIVLQQNFRSNHEIVEHTNAICSAVFPANYNINEGQVAYTPAVSVHEDTAHVEMRPFTQGEEHLERDYIADIVMRTQLAHPEYSIGILCRTATEFGSISAHLQNQGIQSTAYKNIKLLKHPLVKDLLVLCNIMTCGHDTLAWLSLLRSPYVGLELSELLYFADTNDIYAHIPQIIQQYPHLERLALVYKALSYAFAHKDSLGVSNSIHTIVSQLGMREMWSTEDKEVYALFSTLLHAWELAGQSSLSELESALSQEYVPSTASMVTLLTIHKAKGLEFDVVILPMLNHRSRPDTAKLMYLTEFMDIGVLLAAYSETSLYTYLKDNYKHRAQNELLRLLYVALTRAKKELYMSACLDMSKKTLVNTNTLMEILVGQYLHLWEGKTNAESSTTSRDIQHYKYVLPTPVPLPSVVLSEHIMGLQIHTQMHSALGRIIHFCLEHEEFTPSQERLSFLCEHYNLPISNRAEHVNILYEILHTVRLSVHFDFIFAKRTSTRVEHPLTYQGHTYIIDRIFTQSDVVYIIDYKTIFSGVVVPEQLRSYTLQLQNYAQAVKSIYNKTSAQLSSSPEIKTALFITTTGELLYV